jgi:hypothetical protein
MRRALSCQGTHRFPSMFRSSARNQLTAVCIIFVGLLLIYSNYRTSSDTRRTSIDEVEDLLLLPKASNSMSDLINILHAVESNIPLGFAHFNDGEMVALECSDGQKTVFSWSQRCSRRLKEAMQSAFMKTAPNFYIGIPCNCEFRGLAYLVALRFLNITHDLPYRLNDGKSYDDDTQMPLNNDEACPATRPMLTMPNDYLRDRITVATLFINGNYIRAKKELIRIMNKAVTVQNRGVHVVVAHNRKVQNLPFPIKSVKYIAQKDAFEANYDEFRTMSFLTAANYKPNDIVLIMAGPVGRILASEWAFLRSDVTFLEMGSFWDTELWNRPKHHLGISRACMDRNDIIGLSCSHWWVHYIPTIFPEGYLPLTYLC